MSEYYPGLWPYSATKHAVRVLTQGLRNELSAQKTGIRVSVSLYLL
jgi:short-subunit dehydrogenase